MSSSSSSSADDAPRRLHRLLFHLPQDLMEDLYMARELERAGVGVAELHLRLLQQHPEARVVHALGSDHEPLPVWPDVHREAPLRRRFLPSSSALAGHRPAPFQGLQYQPLRPLFFAISSNLFHAKKASQEGSTPPTITLLLL
ncbi:unnamed protein product [Musa acuminata subsp. malaccensis]|uniref:(wild Malaysian banana) hypothetical protein n=1 Tax=Musa acuminata subsp. malaccensis TaxID=214687 RepID=A0A8D7BCD3_MUSAM|nr:unnamed protein product [Musa acuminata subsp. malaccensis]